MAVTVYTHGDFERAVSAIRERTSLNVRVGLVLGSGLGGLADLVEESVSIPYGEIPGFPASTVHGHGGQLVIGMLDGCPVVCQRGRSHFYEGYTPQQITFPIRVMKFLGIDTVILTNASGGVNTSYKTGDVMILNDHINFIGLAGNNPLVGPNDESLGERFIGMTQTYDPELRRIASETAAANGIPAHQGVYLAVSGPNFETPAEIRMIRAVGGDAVGMSTVHEALIARHMRIRVLAMSGISNVCADSIESTDEPNHEEVLEAGKMIAPRMTTILRGVLRAIA